MCFEEYSYMNLTYCSPVPTGHVLFRFLFIKDHLNTYLFLKRIKSGNYVIKASVLSINYFWCHFLVTKVIQFHDLKKYQGLPWWRSGWESACRCRGHGFEPWSGRVPHAAEQLGPWATTAEPARLEPVLRNKRGHDSERPVHHDEEWPLLAATRESPRTETKTQHSHK